VISNATTPDQYFSELPPERQEAMSRLRDILRKHLPDGFQEGISSGMVGYCVPHSAYPAGYHCDPKQPLPFISLASQKSHIALYHMGIYADPNLLKWFTESHAKASAKKLDMGKSCMRYKKPEDIPYKLIGELVSKMTPEEWIDLYESKFKNQRKTK
jgi:hypothetical protein